MESVEEEAARARWWLLSACWWLGAEERRRVRVAPEVEEMRAEVTEEEEEEAEEEEDPVTVTSVEDAGMLRAVEMEDCMLLARLSTLVTGMVTVRSMVRMGGMSVHWGEEAAKDTVRRVTMGVVAMEERLEMSWAMTEGVSGRMPRLTRAGTEEDTVEEAAEAAASPPVPVVEVGLCMVAGRHTGEDWVKAPRVLEMRCSSMLAMS